MVGYILRFRNLEVVTLEIESMFPVNRVNQSRVSIRFASTEQDQDPEPYDDSVHDSFGDAFFRMFGGKPDHSDKPRLTPEELKKRKEIADAFTRTGFM